MIVLAAAVLAAAAPSVSPQPFRYERTLQPAGSGPVQLVPDGTLFAHARSDFSDLRIVDARGGQVPWRPAPEPEPGTRLERQVAVLDSGRRGGAAVARLDLGAGHGLVDRITVSVPDRRFVGSLTVYGSDDRRAWTRLSTTEIYAVGGAAPARSTTALLPPTDFRYLELRATHVTRIEQATVAGTPHAPRPLRLPAHVRTSRGVVVVDLGHRNVPVDQLRISASTPRYYRPFTVEAGGTVVAAGDLVRLGRPRTTVVPLTASARYLRVRIENGDDPPLRGIRVTALARPRTLLVEGGHAAPLTLYYGGRVEPPDYDYGRLPRSSLALARARPGSLGPERPNPLYRIVDTRTFFARHRSLVTLALVAAALVVVGTAVVAVRRA